MTNVAPRIKELIESLGYSNTDFAKEIGLNPAIVSHILSGRNKPSLQVIERIKTNFTNVNLDYLLLGQGMLFANVKKEVSEVNMGGFSGLPNEGVRIASVQGAPPPAEIINTEPIETNVKKEEPIEKSIIDNSSPNKAVERVLIFYKDGTFSSYTPQ